MFCLSRVNRPFQKRSASSPMSPRFIQGLPLQPKGTVERIDLTGYQIDPRFSRQPPGGATDKTMPDRAESPEERKQLRAAHGAVTARREFVEALAIMRATLESTTDAILVIGEKSKIIDFNQRFIGMWKIPRA